MERPQGAANGLLRWPHGLGLFLLLQLLPPATFGQDRLDAPPPPAAPLPRWSGPIGVSWGLRAAAAGGAFPRGGRWRRSAPGEDEECGRVRDFVAKLANNTHQVSGRRGRAPLGFEVPPARPATPERDPGPAAPAPPGPQPRNCGGRAGGRSRARAAGGAVFQVGLRRSKGVSSLGQNFRGGEAGVQEARSSDRVTAPQTEFCPVAQTGLELLGSSAPPTLAFHRDGIRGLSYYALPGGLFGSDTALETMIFLQPEGIDVDEASGITLNVCAHQLLVVERQWGLLAKDVHLALQDGHLHFPFHSLLGLGDAVADKFTLKAVPETGIDQLSKFQAQALFDFAHFPVHGEGLDV
ncbi:Sortilin [Plecturocebus cupreus]